MSPSDPRARVDIISPIWNQMERTKRFVESVIRHTDYPYRLILIDNGSEAPTRAYLESLTQDKRLSVLLIRNEENLGNIKAVNQGIRASDAEYMILEDNDTIVTPHWLSEMIAVAKSEPDIGIVNPISNASGWEPAKDQSIDEYAGTLYARWRGCYSEMATAVGYSFLITRKLVNAIGVWDETFGMGYYEDRDYSRRAVRAGFKIAYAKAAYVYHEEHSSFRVRPEWLELQEKNRAIYEARYGRPKRYLYVITERNEPLMQKMLGDAYAKARENHFIWIFITEDVLPMDYVDHSNIDFFVLPSWACAPAMLWKVLKRKKKFAEIFVDRASHRMWLRSTAPLHRADVHMLDEQTLLNHSPEKLALATS